MRHQCVAGAAQRIRHACRVAQSDIAREVGVTSAAVSQWERALATPQREQALAYARVLHELEAEVARAQDASHQLPEMTFIEEPQPLEHP